MGVRTDIYGVTDSGLFSGWLVALLVAIDFAPVSEELVAACSERRESRKREDDRVACLSARRP